MKLDGNKKNLLIKPWSRKKDVDSTFWKKNPIWFFVGIFFFKLIFVCFVLFLLSFHWQWVSLFPELPSWVAHLWIIE